MEVNVKNAVPWDQFDYALLAGYDFLPRRKGKERLYYWSQVITADTETARYTDDILFVTDWSITMQDIGCVYGHHARDMIRFLTNVMERLKISGNRRLPVYIHNFPYDYMYLKNFMLEAWGEPTYALATKPHRYITMQFASGVEFRDSYILAQRSLENFCKDMGCEAQKKVGAWDYDKFRTPASPRTKDEIEYFLLDTIAQNEAIVRLMKMHGVNNATCELTNTGFVRKEGRKCAGKDKTWRAKFLKQALSADEYKALNDVYHGGYTHANRFHIGEIQQDVVSYDFASSYPSVMCYEKFPMGQFKKISGLSLEEIVELSEDYAFFGYAYFTGLKCKDLFSMPPVSKHKCKYIVDSICDNGKVVTASAVLIPFSDPDIFPIMSAYEWDSCQIGDLWFTQKYYLPDWFTHEFLMPLYENKCTLKKADPGLYMKSKGMLNSLYGMAVQKIVRADYIEDYATGNWDPPADPMRNLDEIEKQLSEFYGKFSKYLPFQWGVWTTAYAMKNLFEMGACCGEWLYCDTDSVKGKNWDKEKLNIYNKRIAKKAKARNLGIVQFDGKEFMLGRAEFDGEYQEFVTLGSKRYCYREDGELHITVAGVPKGAVIQLGDDIRNFRKGFKFDSSLPGMGKLRSTYINVSGIKTVVIDGETIEYGSAVRLDPCDYDLDQTFLFDKYTGLPLKPVYDYGE